MIPLGSNPNKKHHRLLAVMFALILLLGIFLWYQNNHSAIPSYSESVNNVASSNSYSLPASKPTKIKITSLKINADVITLGLNPDKTLEVPQNYSQVGWYTGSPTPGEIGPSVMVGHLDSATDKAVFYNLKKIKPYDIIEIQREDGSTAKFQVESSENFSQDNFPTDKVYGAINYSGLRLITCAGTYNRLKGHYSDNLVVFARLVRPN